MRVPATTSISSLAAQRALPLVLDRTAHYLAPSGRFCVWVPRPGADDELFIYRTPGGAVPAAWTRAEGFFLTARNLRIMRRVG